MVLVCGLYWNNYSHQCHWKWWIFTSLLCSSVNIHHYLPPFRWIIVKYFVHRGGLYIFQFLLSWLLSFCWYLSLSWFSTKREAEFSGQDCKLWKQSWYHCLSLFPISPTSTSFLSLRGSQWSNVRVNYSFCFIYLRINCLTPNLSLFHTVTTILHKPMTVMESSM